MKSCMLIVHNHNMMQILYAVTCIFSVCIYVHVRGELAGNKRSLTHCPSSQGWAFRCPVIDWVGVSSSVLYAHSVHVYGRLLTYFSVSLLVV